MARLIIVLFFFLVSLLCVFRAPAYLLWYVSILVTEFPWIFITVMIALLAWGLKAERFRGVSNVVSIVSLVLFFMPVIRSYYMSATLSQKLTNAFNDGVNDGVKPYSFWHMITGIGAQQVPYKTLYYTAAKDSAQTLDFYAAAQKGKRPCIVVVHGGSWSGGDSKQLPELNSVLAKGGYNVVSINYRLAPLHTIPAPVDDVRSTLAYLRAHADELNIDTNNFVLVGRSAGGQIVLSAAYMLHDAGIKGVISFYGPTDMVYGYHHPANKLVLDTKDVMEQYLGGTYEQVPQNYVASSAINYVTPQSPATLIIHGDNDPLVSPRNSTTLDIKLQENGVKHFFLSLPFATHGCDYTLNGPSGQLTTYAVMRFVADATK